MSFDHLSVAGTRNLTAESHAPLNDWDNVALAGVGDCHDTAHVTWESAWIDIGGEG